MRERRINLCLINFTIRNTTVGVDFHPTVFLQVSCFVDPVSARRRDFQRFAIDMRSGKVGVMTRVRWYVLVLTVIMAAASLSAWGAVFVSVAVGPPALPVYTQPLCPGPGYIWTPGYWAWSPDGYYWVPGTWVLPPQVGFLWTPGYWGFSAGLYYWHAGFWGPTIGFYGGINYGFGYPGQGYYGGHWRGRDFYYNRSVNNVNITNIHNVYNQTVVNNVNVNRVSYNGGPHGIQARPSSQQLAAERGQRMAATSMQTQHEQAARNDRAQLAAVNHGRPAVMATPRPGDLNPRAASQGKRPEAATNTTSAAHNVPRPPQNNQQQRTTENAPRPQQSIHSQEQVAHNVPRPPENRQQVSATQNAARAGNNARQPAPQTQVHANNRPQQQTRNAPRPDNTQRTAAQYRPQSQSQARQAYNPPHQPAQHMTQAPLSSRPAQPVHQAAHSSPAPAGHQQQRPH